jgi:C4-dicarboxylate-specific signal transduction histidine kinase
MTALSRLAVLIATALLWVIAIQEYNAFPELLANFEIRDQALNGAKIAAGEQRKVVERIREMMVTLSKLPAVKTKDRLACNAYLTTVKSQFPELITFLVTDLSGVSFCETNSDHRPITIAARPYFNTVLQTGEFTVGEFTTGLSTGQNVVQFALPFRDDGGHVAGVIVAALSLDWLGDYVARMDIPKGTVLAVMDESGTYLARSSEKDRFVGTKKPGWKNVKLDERGAVDVLDVDAVKRVEGYSAVPAGAGRLVVSFGIDRNARVENVSREAGFGAQRSVGCPSD